MTGLTNNEPPFRFFDPRDELAIVERGLPHWSQAGTLCFITLRTWDSIPKAVLADWIRQRHQWLSDHGIDVVAIPNAPRQRSRKSDDQRPNWRRQLEQLEVSLQREFHEKSTSLWHAILDECHGECVLRRPELSKIVADSLKHFDGQRYEMADFIVMPNHLHMLVAFMNEDKMLEQCESWKRFTATRINRRLERRGRFWQQDGFDHLVRSVEQFEYLRRYIAENPFVARLDAGEFIHFSKDYS